jgi:hypothetical protein
MLYFMDADVNALLGRYRADFPEQRETSVDNSRTARE